MKAISTNVIVKLDEFYYTAETSWLRNILFIPLAKK